jgi:hypothetical protein
MLRDIRASELSETINNVNEIVGYFHFSNKKKTGTCRTSWAGVSLPQSRTTQAEHFTT